MPTVLIMSKNRRVLYD